MSLMRRSSRAAGPEVEERWRSPPAAAASPSSTASARHRPPAERAEAPADRPTSAGRAAKGYPRARRARARRSAKRLRRKAKSVKEDAPARAYHHQRKERAPITYRVLRGGDDGVPLTTPTPLDRAESASRGPTTGHPPFGGARTPPAPIRRALPGSRGAAGEHLWPEPTVRRPERLDARILPADGSRPLNLPNMELS